MTPEQIIAEELWKQKVAVSNLSLDTIATKVVNRLAREGFLAAETSTEERARVALMDLAAESLRATEDGLKGYLASSFAAVIELHNEEHEYTFYAVAKPRSQNPALTSGLFRMGEKMVFESQGTFE